MEYEYLLKTKQKKQQMKTINMELSSIVHSFHFDLATGNVKIKLHHSRN